MKSTFLESGRMEFLMESAYLKGEGWRLVTESAYLEDGGMEADDLVILPERWRDGGC